MASHRSDFISRHLSNSTVLNLGKQSSAGCFSVAQSYTSFLQYVVFPMPGFPSIKTVLGCGHSSCGLKIPDMFTVSAVAVPLVFFLPTTLSLVKISSR